MPGSRMICDFATPALRARETDLRNPCVTSRRTLRAKPPCCMVRGSPRMCIRMSGTCCSRAASAMRGSFFSPETSLMISAPARRASSASVHRNGDLEPSAQAFQNGKNPVELLRSLHFFRPRTRGFPTDVQKVGAGEFHGEGVLDGVRGIGKLAAVEKTVRRHIQHAHDQCALAEHKCARGELQTEGSAPQGHRRNRV